jgi:acetoin:2,6-dichlorophenolindophenol oxidoreductase subunit alpha
MGPVLAELLGRENGVLQGKGGSMHLTELNMMGSLRHHRRPPVHRQWGAWSAQLRGTDQVAVCFFGDGTTNIGAFHEALNFAAVWNLPVIFVCENNLYMEYTPIDMVARCPTRPPIGPPPTVSSRSWSMATTPTPCTWWPPT